MVTWNSFLLGQRDPCFMQMGGIQSSPITVFTTFLFALQLLYHPVSAGTCWFVVNANGKCQSVSAMRATREECCQTSYATMGWSPHENPSVGEIFQWQFLIGGAPECQACHETCDRVQCEPGKRCEVRQGRARCVCAPDCTSLRYPEQLQGDRRICGSDERTYKNHCSLLKHNCRRGSQVYLDYYGACQRSCHGVHCPDNLHCVTDQNGLPHCIPCIRHCPTVQPGQEVCGEDGVTYQSLCHYRKHTCHHGRAIGIAYNGRCQANPTCNTINCERGHRCLQNLQTGSPQCMDCDMPCSETVFGHHPVCGSDDRTYSSWCSLMRASCNRGIIIRTQHSGSCGGAVSGPRGGEEIGSEDNED